METEHHGRLVAGEPLDGLVTALAQMRGTQARDGSYRLRAMLAPEVGAPLMRALMRIEAELLLHDAKHLAPGGEEPRSPEQRGADAFVALALRVQDAVQADRPSGSPE